MSTALGTSRKPLTIPADLVSAFCYESRRHAAASFASPAAIERAGEVLLGLLRRGMTSVSFGVVLDWTMLIDREWDFPSRTLDHSGVSDAANPLRDSLAPLPVEYENECLNPYLLSPHLRRVRDIIVLRGRSVPRLVHLLEQIFEGVEKHLPFTISFFELVPHRLPPFFAVAESGGAGPAASGQSSTGGDGATESGDDIRDGHGFETTDDDGFDDATNAESGGTPLERFNAQFPDAVAALHDAIADFLRKRLSAEPLMDEGDPRAVPPYRPTDVDLYELEHVEIFTSRVARLRCRRFGEIGQALGPPETRGLNRLVDIPEVVVNRDDETQYPAGGVAELTNRGSFENLLPSELMYLEDDPEQVDIFSLKYVESELLFFVRDAGLLVRRRRRLNIAIWDVPSFRVKYPHQAHSLEVLLDGMLVRLFRDLFDYFEGEGLRLTAHWVFPSGIADRAFGGESSPAPGARSMADPGDDDAGVDALVKPVATPSISGQGPQDLFNLLFQTEREKQLADFQVHDSADSIAEYLRENDHPLNQWAVILPPHYGNAGQSPKSVLADLLPTWTAMYRRSGKPATTVTWATQPPAKSPRTFELPHITLPPELQCTNPGDDDGLREVGFQFPATAADPIPALRALWQFLLNVLITFA